jgi:hypothetical protein
MVEPEPEVPERETLVQPRRVVGARFESERVPGWVVELSCGHTIWSAARPAVRQYCGQCLVKLAKYAAELEASQKRPE